MVRSEAGMAFQSCPEFRQRDQAFVSLTSHCVLAASPTLAEGQSFKLPADLTPSSWENEHLSCIIASITIDFSFHLERKPACFSSATGLLQKAEQNHG